MTILRHHQSSAFGFASPNFYVSFLAALEIDRNAEAYFPGLKRDSELDLNTVEIPDYLPIATLCEALHINLTLLRAYNLMLMPRVWNGEKYVPAGYTLRLPPGSIDSAKAAQAIAAIPVSRRFAAQLPDEYHIVASGETLSGIAARCGVSISEPILRKQLSSANLI